MPYILDVWWQHAMAFDVCFTAYIYSLVLYSVGQIVLYQTYKWVGDRYRHILDLLLWYSHFQYKIRIIQDFVQSRSFSGWKRKNLKLPLNTNWIKWWQLSPSLSMLKHHFERSRERKIRGPRKRNMKKLGRFFTVSCSFSQPIWAG